MNIGSAAYRLFIGPLELLFETIFSISNRIVYHPGIAIIILSLTMNFLVLPLYMRADALQEEERNREAKMRPWIVHIKKTFQGDERFMMLQAYYKQNGYKPTDALKGSVSLLLEIPFFIAAYNFLSGLQLLNGVSFGPIKDLGGPDGLIQFAGYSINLLPILMTVINGLSAALYMKGFPLKSKIQMYGIAVIFLVFLYTSPAGLVFYWTLNNCFSLLKNIFYRLKNPGKVLAIMASAVGIMGLVYFGLIKPFTTPRAETMMIAALLLLQVPIVLLYLRRFNLRLFSNGENTSDAVRFFLGVIYVTLLTGVLIPTAVVNSSPGEFVDVLSYNSPLWYVVYTLLIAAGTFILWGGVFYRLATNHIRRWIELLIWIVCGVATVNYMLFGTKNGDLSTQLVYDVAPTFSRGELLINSLTIIVVAFILYMIWKKVPGIIRVVLITLCLAILGMSGKNIVGIQKNLVEVSASVRENKDSFPELALSKASKNVIVLMMDRAIGYYFPFIMEELPELKESFSGFTFFPNTISFGSATNVGSAPLFGGYEYTPKEINKRVKEPLVDKQNEALRVLPVLFDEAGYQVTVCDPPYAGYQNPPDLHIYDDYPEIRRYLTDGRFVVSELNNEVESVRIRNFFYYSLFRVSPMLLQPTFYSDGLYNDADALAGLSPNIATDQVVSDDLLEAAGVDISFQKAYGVLENLKSITTISNDNRGSFLMMSNNTTHEELLLQMPEYTPSSLVDNHEFEQLPIKRSSIDGEVIEFVTADQLKHYHSNLITYKKLGEWFDYLKEQGVYDNTRIIITADHGKTQRFKQHVIKEDIWCDMLAFNPVLLVKDFGSTEFIVDSQFMTHADVPVYALEGVVEDARNPFTGKSISNSKKRGEAQEIMYVRDIHIKSNNGNTFLPGLWFSVKDNIFDQSNWDVLGEM